MKLKNLNISDIKEAPYNIRFNTDDKAMESLINSIERGFTFIELQRNFGLSIRDIAERTCRSSTEVGLFLQIVTELQ